MKYIQLNQLTVNAEGKTEDIGDAYIIPSHIVSVSDIWDKHDVVIEGVCLITMVNGNNRVVRGYCKDIVFKLEEASLCS
jgi:hypothetical protein